MPLTNRELITEYAGRLNPALLTGQAVTSPLGVWLLLALVAPAGQGSDRDGLEAVLGATADDAAARAAALLSDPHPAVSAAAAVWDRMLGPTFERLGAATCRRSSSVARCRARRTRTRGRGSGRWG